jgi:AraC-like DNA-binding protein
MPVRPRHPEPVATLLTPAERQRVDAAGEGCYVTLHRESMDELLLDLRSQRASAVLVSVSRYRTHDAPQVARLVREFPRIPAVALLSASEPSSTHALLALGQQGVRSLIDVRDPRGWRDLRQLITSERSDNIQRVAIARITTDLEGTTPDCLRFFEMLFLAPVTVTTIRQLARTMDVVPSTFMSRFFRARLPAPKRYLAMARLVRAARLFENPGLSIAQVSHRMEYSSPQSFSRHVQATLGCTPVDFRRRFDGEGMLDQMRHELVLPYLATLRTFHPFALPPQWMPRPAS